MQTDMEKKMRNRCVLGLVILLGLLAFFLLLSICIGSVSVSPQEVLAVLQGKARSGYGQGYRAFHPSAPGAGGAVPGRGAGTVRVSFAVLFSQSHCGALCLRNFFRGQNSVWRWSWWRF